MHAAGVDVRKCASGSWSRLVCSQGAVIFRSLGTESTLNGCEIQFLLAERAESSNEGPTKAVGPGAGLCGGLGS